MRRDAVLRGFTYVGRYCNGSVALRRDLAMIVGIVKGCCDCFAALQGASAMTSIDAKHCKISSVWAKQKLLSGTRG